jgi:hypothetical protein
MSTSVYRRTIVEMLALLLESIDNCRKSTSDKQAWENRYTDRFNYLEKNFLPSGSGIDCGTKILDDKSSRTKLVFKCSFHHMDEHGGYDGWTEHTVIVTPAFDGIDVVVKGRNRNEIKDHIADRFRYELLQYVELDHENDKYIRSKVQS